MRLFLAHVVDFLHSYVFRHHPFWTCRYVLDLWPDEDHECWFCGKFWAHGDRGEPS